MNEVIASVRAMFGTGSSEPSVVDLRQLVDEVLALAQGELATLKITLRNNMNTELPAVMAERVPIQQVVLNLVMNAIEAMSSVVGRERCLTIGSSFDQQVNHHRGYGKRNRSGSAPPHLRPVLYNKIQRNGLGPFH